MPNDKRLAPETWEPPTIHPLSSLGEQTAPTTISASSPEKHISDISDLLELLKLGGEDYAQDS